MKFLKGMILGTVVAAGVAMMYSDEFNKKKIMKKGRQIIKKMGM
jgi:gas vesicle protein